MDLLNDLRREILKYLPLSSPDPAVSKALSDMSTEYLLIQFFNWLGRLVHPHPRTVLTPRERLANPLWTKHRSDIELIVKKMEQGDDLNPHLSKRIRDGFALHKGPKKNLNKRRDLDLLLNEWCVHHLHLSNVVEPDGFVKGDDPLLFAIFTPSAAYLLDIMPHGAWTDQRLVEIAVRNWPNADLFHRLNGILPANPSRTSKDRHQLRGSGITAAVEIDGCVYVSRSLGISTAGTSINTTRQADHLLAQIRAVTRGLRENADFLRPYIEQAGKAYPEHPSFSLVLASGPSGYGFAIREKETGVPVALP